MKFVIGLVVALLVIVGALYGLAKAKVLPVAGIAKTSPIAKTLLTQLKLLPPVQKKATTVAASTAASPAAAQIDPLAEQKAQLATAQAEVAQEKIALDKKMASIGSLPAPGPITQTAPHLVEIYEAMGSDDLAALFAKEPDSVVVSALVAMDTKKAAKALAAIPPERQVKLTALMNQAMATAPNTPPQPAT
jgi:flagellar motility protein MotE (MotC chaperone)